MGMFWRSFSLFLLLLGLSNELNDFEIGFDRCKEEAACFVRGSCIEKVGDQGSTRESENELVRFKETSTTITLDEDCNVVMNIKPYSSNIFLVTMKVKASYDEPMESGSVVLQHGSIQFPCGKVLNGLVVDNNFQLYTLGEPYYSKNYAYCALEIHNYGSTDKSLAEKFEAYAAKPTIKYSNEAKTKDYLIEYHENADILYREVAKLSQCSPLNIATISREESDEYTSEYQLEELDTTRSTLSCDTFYWRLGNELLLRIVRENGVVVFPTKMECITTPLGWQYDDATSKGNLIPEGERLKGHCIRKNCAFCSIYEIHETLCTGCTKPQLIIRDGCKIAVCPNNKWTRNGGVHVGTAECRKDTEYLWFYSGSNDKVVNGGCSDKSCSLCTDMNVDLNSCIGCTSPSISVKDGCKVAECPNNKWRRDGGVHVGTVVCRQFFAHVLEVAWYYSDNDKVVNGGCSDKYDCVVFSNLDLKVGVTTNGITLTCSDPSQFVKTSQGITSASFTCDDSDGLYKNGGKTVLKKESVSCVKDCLACADFTTDLNRCIGCTQPTTTERDGCKFAECPNNKWRINGGVIDGKVECRQDTANPTEVAWFVSGGNEKGTGGCSEKFDCTEYSKLTLGEGVNSHGKNLRCSDSSFVIKTSQGIVSTSFVCDDSTGLYKDGEKIVQKGEKLTCEKNSTSDAQKADANSSTVTFAVCGVFGVILVVGIILAVVFYMRKKKNVAPPKEKNPEPVVEAAKSKEAPSPVTPTTPVSGPSSVTPTTPI